jgi:deazaflavin-dependent oxidoreductase (nitroreductase family)
MTWRRPEQPGLGMSQYSDRAGVDSRATGSGVQPRKYMIYNIDTSDGRAWIERNLDERCSSESRHCIKRGAAEGWPSPKRKWPNNFFSMEEAMIDMNDWNRRTIEEFRANKGKVGGMWEGRPLLLLTTTGLKSGQQRTTPLMYMREADHLYIFASKAGAPSHPDWYRNLLAKAEVAVEVGAEKFNANAVEIKGETRDQIYAKWAGQYPQFQDYQNKTTRKIPVIELKRQA